MFPVYVFDGNPPDLKAAEIQKRMDKRISAKEALDIAIFEGDEEEIEKQSRRLVKGGLISESSFHFVQVNERLVLLQVPNILNTLGWSTFFCVGPKIYLHIVPVSASRKHFVPDKKMICIL